MRRIVTLAALVALVASFAIGTAALAGKGSQDRDQTRDGIQQQDRDRDHICDCGNYIDADGDGYCDNCDCPGAPQDGTGNQYRGGR